MDDAEWTEKVMDEAEELLPTLVAAGYAVVDDDGKRASGTRGGSRRKGSPV
jgi:hypothetical protein